MREIVATALLLGAIAFPFILMPLLWRRMRRTQAQDYERREAQVEQPWDEQMDERQGLGAGRAHRPNEDLIQLGSGARESRWPLDNS